MQSLGVTLGRLGDSAGTWTGRGEPDWETSDPDGGYAPPEIPLAVSQDWIGAGPDASGRVWRARRRMAARWWRTAAVLFLVTAVAYGLNAGGHLQRLAADLTAGTSLAAVRAGFTVQALSVEGQNRTSNADIVQALGIGARTSMLSLDTAAAQRRLEMLPWVRHAQIMRLLPSTLQVVIEEREPFAVWQLDGKLHLVDDEGKVLGPATAARSDLPLIVGEGAAQNAQALFTSLAAYPKLRERVTAAIRVADRRWTLKLANDVDVSLPEDNMDRALDKLAELEKTHGLLEGDVVAVDLRLPDRVSLRLTKAAAARWHDALKRSEQGRERSARDT